MKRWFYFAQEDLVDGVLTQTTWRGHGELTRWSSVVLRQRRFCLGPIRFFYAGQQVEVELIWKLFNDETGFKGCYE